MQQRLECVEEQLQIWVQKYRLLALILCVAGLAIEVLYQIKLIKCIASSSCLHLLAMSTALNELRIASISRGARFLSLMGSFDKKPEEWRRLY